jgi:hypothetical protein
MMSYRTAEETALLLYRMLMNSEKNRARVSEATIRRISRRTLLRTPFLNDLKNECDGIGLILGQLHRGGFGLMYASLLEGAPSITSKSYLTDEMELMKDAGKREELFDKIRMQTEEPIDDADET